MEGPLPAAEAYGKAAQGDVAVRARVAKALGVFAEIPGELRGELGIRGVEVFAQFECLGLGRITGERKVELRRWNAVESGGRLGGGNFKSSLFRGGADVFSKLCFKSHDLGLSF